MREGRTYGAQKREAKTEMLERLGKRTMVDLGFKIKKETTEAGSTEIQAVSNVGESQLKIIYSVEKLCYKVRIDIPGLATFNGEAKDMGEMKRILCYMEFIARFPKEFLRFSKPQKFFYFIFSTTKPRQYYDAVHRLAVKYSNHHFAFDDELIKDIKKITA